MQYFAILMSQMIQNSVSPLKETRILYIEGTADAVFALLRSQMFQIITTNQIYYVKSA